MKTNFCRNIGAALALCCVAGLTPLALAAEAPASNRWSADPRLQQPAVAAAATTLAGGDAKKCIEQLRAAVMKDAQLPPPLLLLAYIQLANGRLPQALVALDTAAVEDKKHPEIYLTLGQIAATQGRNADAWVHLHKALKLKPPATWSQAFHVGFQVRCYEELTGVVERRRDWEELEASLEKWAWLEPENERLRNAWGRALLLSHRDEDAFVQFAKAHELNPAQNPPELSMAAVYVERGEFERANPWYEKAAAANPQAARVYLEYGAGLLLADDFAAAQKQLQRTAELDAQPMQLGIDLPLLRGYAARGLKDYVLAEQMLTEVLRKSPGHVGALTQLVLTLDEQREDPAKRQRALELATILANKNAASPQALTALGWVQFRNSQAKEAEETMLRAMSFDTNDPQSLYLAAQVLLARGRSAEASQVIKALQEAMSAPSLFVDRAAARQWLDRVSLAVP